MCVFDVLEKIMNVECVYNVYIYDLKNKTYGRDCIV